ncbi:MAG: hypothetical protein QG633_175 [Patescibacteria group bacterium]|nr:hypothetical protein [Patescibacteria group bacterium]
MESPLINDMRSPMQPAPSMPAVETHKQRNGIIMVVVFILILLALAFWFADMKPSVRYDDAGNMITDAAPGVVVAGFPTELLRESGVIIEGSYSIAYETEGKEMPYARYTSAESYAQNVRLFRALLQETGWTILRDGSVDEVPVTNFYASKDAAEANIMLTQNGNGSVTVQISYITTK